MSNAAVFAAGLASIVLNTSRRVATVPVGDLKHPPNWVRQDLGTKEEQIALARSYQARPINLILISPHGVIRDGNRRVASIIEDTGPETPVMVCITDEEITPAVMLEIQIESTEHTKSLTSFEQYVGYSKWLELNPEATAKDLAAKIHRHESTISKILSLSKCAPEVMEAAKAGELNVSDWSAISKAKPEDQLGLLAFRLSTDANRETMEAQVKKKRAASVPAVRASKIKIVLTSGATVTIRGADLSLDDAIEAVNDAHKEMRKGRDQGLDAKTLVAVCRDKANAGG